MNNEDRTVVERAAAALEKEALISASDIDPDAALINHPRIDDAGFYRIIADVERRLGISSEEGTWHFDEGLVKAVSSLKCNGTG